MITNKAELIEKIAHYLCDEFYLVYCDTCANRNKDSDDCEYCHRKAMNWSLSVAAGRDTAEEVLKLLDYDNLHTLTKPVFDGDEWKCSNCGYRETIFSHFDYCPHCGKKIDWKAWDETFKYSW